MNSSNLSIERFFFFLHIYEGRENTATFIPMACALLKIGRLNVSGMLKNPRIEVFFFFEVIPERKEGIWALVRKPRTLCIQEETAMKVKD